MDVKVIYPRPQEKEKAAFGEAAGELDLLQLHRTMEEHTFQVGLSYARALGHLEGRVKSVAQDLLFGADGPGAAIRLGEAIREAEAVLEEGARNDT